MYKFLFATALALSSQVASAIEIVNDLPVEDLQVVKKGINVVVTGILTNTSGKTLTSATVTFALLDGQGIQVGSAIAAAMGIESGRKWKFEALPGTRSAFAEAKLVRVQAVTE